MRFNRNQKRQTARKTTNAEGGIAYVLPKKLELIQRVSTWLVNEPKFYGDTASENEDIINLIHDVIDESPEFVLKVAAYTRQVLQLRTAPIVLLVEASLNDNSKKFVRRYVPLIVRRADQMAEALAYLKSRIGDLGDQQGEGSIPAGLKKGLADVFEKFDEYALAKYNRDAEVKLKDVWKLVHPKPANRARYNLYKRLLNNDLKTPETWETIISNEGSNKEAWIKASEVMPYFALVRNLRNLIQNGVPLKKVLAQIKDPARVASGKLLPFRYLSAYREIEKVASVNSTDVLDTLEEAMEASIDNLPKLDGTTFIAIDHSASMESTISSESVVTRIDTADALGAIAHKSSEKVVVGVFSNEYKTVTLSRKNSTLENMNKLKNSIEIGGTYTYKVFETLLDSKLFVDRVILITDEEGYGGEAYNLFEEYKRRINSKAKLYIMNVAGYGTSEAPATDRNVVHLAGWSEKILNFIDIFEGGDGKVLQQIESISV